MPEAREWMEFFYPFLFDSSDSRYVTEKDLLLSISVAADYRPACLTPERQNQAQAHYAAYIAEFRLRLQKAGISNSSLTGTVVGPIIEKKEGDSSVKYSTSAVTTTSASSIKSQLTGPGTAYAAWLALWEICTPIAVDGQKPVRRGAIMTSFG